MAIVVSQGSEPLPGYRLFERLGKGGFGEVWKCEAPGGFLKAMKFVPYDLGPLQAPANVELTALQQLKSIRHPFLVSIERVEKVEELLVIVMELAEESLRDVLQDCQRGGSSGMLHGETLAYLDEVAEVLDLMNLQHHLLHLDVKPDNIFLMGEHAKVGDFGMVTALGPGGKRRRQAPPGLSPSYAAPEVFEGNAGPRSDQYSLAIVYYEVRTGSIPFDGRNPRQLMFQHCIQAPDLKLLPPEERGVVARALAKEPADRFPCCKDFIAALHTDRRPAKRERTVVAARAPGKQENGLMPARLNDSTVRPSRLTEPTTSPESLLADLMARYGGAELENRTPDRTENNAPGLLTRRFLSPVLRGLLRLRIDEFLRFWNGRVISQAGDVVYCQVNLPTSYAERYPGCLPAFSVEVRLLLPSIPLETKTEVEARVRPAAGETGVGEQRMLQEIGPLLLESLAKYLAARADRRDCRRVTWQRPLLVSPICPSTGEKGASILGHGEDLSLSGLKFCIPVEPTTPALVIDLTRAERPAVILPALVVRSHPRGTGWEVVARFIWDGG
jgi:serine/threonine protein kinase